ncbi:MAG: AAA family ATPase, partial [Acidobacteriota bacterium]
EAQNLSLATLEELRMLSNLETEKSKLLQIILVGQPSLRDKLAAPELEQLRQRITVSYHLSPLDADETANYINHRLRRAAIGAPLEFPRSVTDVIHARSRGVPRIINVICDAALVFGYAEERRQVDPPLMGEVLTELEATGVLPSASTPAAPGAEAVYEPVASSGIRSVSPVPGSAFAPPAARPAQPPAHSSEPGAMLAPATDGPAGGSGWNLADPLATLRAEALIERAALLDRREQTLRQRERELADQRRVLAEEYRLLRGQRSGAAAPPESGVPGGTRVASAAQAIGPARHETLWMRLKRLMSGDAPPAIEEN